MSNKIKTIITYAVALVLLLFLTSFMFTMNKEEEVKPKYYEILQLFENAEVESVTTTATYENTSNFTIGSEEYHNLLVENGYSDEPGDENYAVFIGGEDVVPPFVIAPEDYGDEGYETKSFKYYADSVLTDEEGEIISDPESVIGEALSKFGVYEEDSVYVRDIEAEVDYEILKDERAYADIIRRTMDVDSDE